VPQLVGHPTWWADDRWANAKFTGPIIYSPGIPPDYWIDAQSLVAGTVAPCTSSITVFDTE
jgi:hypothetical protein